MTQPTTYSTPFLVLAGATLVAALLLMNDLVSLWPGAEAAQVWRQVEGGPGYWWADVWGHLLVGESGGFLAFWLRLPNILLMLGGLGGIFFIGRRLLGTFRMFSWILVMSSSLLLVNLAKAATADTSLWVFQALSTLSLLRYLKQPKRIWWGLSFVFAALAFWSYPLQALLWGAGLYVPLFLLHPAKKVLLQSAWWLILPLAGGWLWLQGIFPWKYAAMAMGWGGQLELSWNYGWHLLGLLPWMGFLVAGIVELARRLRKREELAILQLSILLSGLASGGMILQVAFAFLIMRQVADFANPNYPNRGLVKTFSIIHLVSVFIIGVILLLGGFLNFGGLGFRTVMAVSLPYWIASFLTVSGLVGLDSRYYIGAPFFAGLLLTATAWIQLGPLLEVRRNLPKELPTFIENDPNFSAPLQIKVADARQAELYYLHAKPKLAPVWVKGLVEDWQGTYLVDSLHLAQARANSDTILLERRFENRVGLDEVGVYWLVLCE